MLINKRGWKMFDGMFNSGCKEFDDIFNDKDKSIEQKHLENLKLIDYCLTELKQRSK